ncbi:MAG: DUF6677 family protein [Acidobacteriota bacterium]
MTPTSDAPPLNSKQPPVATPAPVSVPRQVAVCLAAWLVPGLGHSLLGRYGRAGLISGSIYTMVALGLLMRGHLYSPFASDELRGLRDVLSMVCLIGQMGIGLLQPILRGLGFGIDFEFKAATYEYGTYFLVVAGLLNYLVMFDVFDLAKGRKA